MIRMREEAMVGYFAEMCGHKLPDYPSASHLDMDTQLELISEIVGEIRELKEAVQRGNICDIAHEAADVKYFLMYLVVRLGIPMADVFSAVHEANMTKCDPETGEACRAPSGRIAKGPMYEPPDIESVLARVRA